MENRNNHDTIAEFHSAADLCRDVYEKKLRDYGTSWRVMRPSSLTDQIFIKARRIRTLEENGESYAAVNEGIEPEFIGIVNYCVIALIQLKLGYGDPIPAEKMLFIDLADGRSFAVRPSGTEPKIKFYLFAHGERGAELAASKAAVETSINALWAAVEADARARMA